MGVAVTPGELQAIRVRFGEDAVLKALDREGHGGAGRYGVQPVQVAQVVLVDEGLHVDIQAHRAKGSQRLILRLVRVLDSVFALLDGDLVAAADGAGGAGILLGDEL